jgi:hypothetical protein
MDINLYLDEFQKCINRLDKRPFNDAALQLNVGLYVDSVVLKIQKRSWLNQTPQAKPFRESVFFSVWICDEAIKQNVLFYNIHALKMRELKGYAIKSREFAQDFRQRFKPFEAQWPNVKTDFGPLTLMEGWVKTDPENFENELSDLSHKFLTIEFIIDELLAARRNRY